MKRLLGPALFLFVVGGVVAWYALAASLRSEREYTAWVHALADDESTRVLESRFERGWLHSRAETSIEMSGGTGLAFRAFVTGLGALDVRERVGLHMVHGIEHGPLPLWEWLRAGMEGAPVLARIRSTVEIDHESQRELAEAIGKLPPVEAETIVRAAGHAATHLSVAAQRLRASGEGFARDARFLGASGDLEFRDRYRHLSGTLQSPGFAGRGLERAVELRDVTWVFELPGSELPVGRMELGVGELRVAPAEGDGGLTLADVLLEPSGRVSGGRLEADLLLRVRSVALGAEAYGPATVALDLRDLDAAALRRLRRAGLSLQEGQTDPVATAVAAGELAEALPALLDRGPRAELRELRLATPAGPIAARGRLTLARPDLSSGSLSVGSFFDAELEAEAPASVAESILASLVSPARVRELRTKGALAPDGERARLRVEWRGSSLQLNGVPVPLPPPAPAPAPAPVAGSASAPQAAAQAAAEAGVPEAGATESATEAAPAAERVPAEDTASEAATAEAAAPAAPPGSATPAESVPAAPAPAVVESAPAAPAP